jgi:hypothetical protein
VASGKSEEFQRIVAFSAEMAKTTTVGSDKTERGADALLRGVETPG